MSIETQKGTPAEQPPQRPEQPHAPLPPESLEPVSIPQEPEAGERAAETLAHMQEAAAVAAPAEAGPEAEAQPAPRATLTTEQVTQILQAHQATGGSKSYPKATIGILGATAAFLSFFGALFASLFEKLGGLLGMKSEGGAKSAAKPAGGGGHH